MISLLLLPHLIGMHRGKVGQQSDGDEAKHRGEVPTGHFLWIQRLLADTLSRAIFMWAKLC